MAEDIVNNSNCKANERTNGDFVKEDCKQIALQDISKLKAEVFNGVPESILGSQHWDVYFEWFRGDWTIIEMMNESEKQFGDDFSQGTWGTAKKRMKELGFVVTNYKKSVLNGFELKQLDIRQEMRNAIALHFKRIADIEEKEKTWQGKLGDAPYISSALRAEQDALTRDLMILFQIEQKDTEQKVRLGIEDNREIIDIEPSKEMSERDIQVEVAKLTKEQLGKYQQALFYLRDMAQLYNEIFENILVEEYTECRICLLAYPESYCKVNEFVDLRYEEFPLFKARDIRVNEFVKMVLVTR